MRFPMIGEGGGNDGSRNIVALLATGAGWGMSSWPGPTRSKGPSYHAHLTLLLVAHAIARTPARTPTQVRPASPRESAHMARLTPHFQDFALRLRGPWRSKADVDATPILPFASPPTGSCLLVPPASSSPACGPFKPLPSAKSPPPFLFANLGARHRRRRTLGPLLGFGGIRQLRGKYILLQQADTFAVQLVSSVAAALLNRCSRLSLSLSLSSRTSFSLTGWFPPGSAIL